MSRVLIWIGALFGGIVMTLATWWLIATVFSFGAVAPPQEPETTATLIDTPEEQGSEDEDEASGSKEDETP
jgi:hypothetical protein